MKTSEKILKMKIPVSKINRIIFCVLSIFFISHFPQNIYADNGKLLIIAAASGDAHSVRNLLNRGANVNTTDEDSLTPLITASMLGHTDVVKLLLKANADVNKSVKDDSTPLFIASRLGYSEIVKLLIEAKADVNRSMDGITPLMAATMYGHGKVVKLLLEANAGVNRKVDISGESFSALKMAERKGYIDISMQLKRYGARY